MILSSQSRNKFTMWVAAYRKNGAWLHQHQKRKERYQDAGELLTGPHLTVYSFDLAAKKLWSSGLLRQKNRWQGAGEGIRMLVAYLSSPPLQESLVTIYETALTPTSQGGYKVAGVGPNLVSEILTLHHPQRFGIYNKRSCVAIYDLCSKDFRTGSTNGGHYEEFVQILNELKSVGALEDLMEVDTVLNLAYTDSFKD